ncbi:MAG TPA: hypothetical protein VGT08_18550 [Terracidiphilus sp.]|nr:hypothetical protein [Terracidiphilus sp.]
MWLHFKNLLWQSWIALVASLGTTTFAIVFAFVGFIFILLLNLAFKLRKDGWSWSVTVSHFSKNLKDSLIPTVIGTGVLWCVLYGTFVVRSVYADHRDTVSRLEEMTSARDALNAELHIKDDYINNLKTKSRPMPNASSEEHPKISFSAQPHALTDLQQTVLQRDLSAGAGLRVRINVIGRKQDTRDFAEDLEQVFKGWKVDGGNIGLTNMDFSSELEFVIPNPGDRSVQIAVHAFDHAHVAYSKNVLPEAFTGALIGGPPPALTINVTDR